MYCLRKETGTRAGLAALEAQVIKTLRDPCGGVRRSLQGCLWSLDSCHIVFGVCVFASF